MDRKNLLFVALLVSGVFLITGCREAGKSAGAVVPTVTVRLLSLEPVARYIDLTGTLNSSRSVDLMARVSGYLRSVDFADGTFVEEGQTLFVIEPEPYEQQLHLAEAALLQAQSEYDRQQALLKENATSVANVEKWLSQRDQAAAQVELAKINLGYTRIAAPFSGRIGRHLVDPGNLIGSSGSTKLATLDQITPIYAYFHLSERDALEIRKAMREKNITPGSSIGKAKVLLGLQNEEGFPHEGLLDYVDSGVDLSSGVIEMRAVFPNEDKALFPGLFARVRIPLGEPQPMLVVPQSAIGNDQEGDYVLVVDKDSTVLRRAIVKGPLTQEGCAIASGLTAQDRVVVSGLAQVSPGSKVIPREEAPREFSSEKESL